MKCCVHSNIKNEEYDISDTVIIINPKQAAYYCQRGLELLDLELSNDRKTGEPIFCYVFCRSASKLYFDEWCKRKNELNKENQ